MNATERPDPAPRATSLNARTGAVLALKPLQFAKSRVDSVVPAIRRRLAWTMAVDTLTSVTAVVDHVVVVSDQPALQSTLSGFGVEVEVVADVRTGGLNPALEHGARILQQHGYETIVAAVGDLPALTPTSLLRIVDAAQPDGRSFVPDASGIGTSMLIASRCDLEPRFQGPSASAHLASGATALTDDVVGHPISDARRDVDTEADLLEAYELGLGRRTAALMDPEHRRLGVYVPVTVATTGGKHEDGQVITADGARLTMSTTVISPPLRAVHPGQRLHAATASDRVLSAWL